MKLFSIHFKTAIRQSTNEAFIKLKEDRPRELHQLVRDIHMHFESMPNDWIYITILEAFEELEQGENIEDMNIEPDIYTGELIEWLGNRFAVDLVNQAKAEMGSRDNIEAEIAQGQWMAKDYIYREVYDFIQEQNIEE